jgi:hypothetical protein
VDFGLEQDENHPAINGRDLEIEALFLSLSLISCFLTVTLYTIESEIKGQQQKLFAFHNEKETKEEIDNKSLMESTRSKYGSRSRH